MYTYQLMCSIVCDLRMIFFPVPTSTSIHNASELQENLPSVESQKQFMNKHLPSLHPSPAMSTDIPLCSHSFPTSLPSPAPIQTSCHFGPKDSVVHSGSIPGHSCAPILIPSSSAPISHLTPFPGISEVHNTPLVTEDSIHKYVYSIDVHSIQNLQLGEGLKCFVK